MAVAPDHRGLSVCLPRWREPETELGRGGPQRLGADRHRRRDRRVSAYSRRGRGREGRPRGLAWLLTTLEDPRAQRRSADHQRCVCRAGRGGGRMLSQGPLATVRRPLVSERLLPHAARPDRHRCPDAKGDPRPGGSEGGRTESEGGCREADRAEAAEGCGARPPAVQSDADLLRVPEHPLATDPHQQSARAHHPRSAAAHASRWGLSRWPVRIDVGGNRKFPIYGNRKPHTLVVGGGCPAFHVVDDVNNEGAGQRCMDGRRGCC